MRSITSRRVLALLLAFCSGISCSGRHGVAGGSNDKSNPARSTFLRLRQERTCKLNPEIVRAPGLRGGGDGTGADPQEYEGQFAPDLLDRFSWNMNLSLPTPDGLEHLKVRIRQACVNDVLHLHRMNLICLSENYHLQYFIVSILRCPSLTWMAEVSEEDSVLGRIWKPVGYIFGRTQQPENASVYDLFRPEAQDEVEGQITSLAVLKKYRRLHLGRSLIQRCLTAMKDFYDVRKCSLHVRSSNAVALKLYCEVFDFKVDGIRSRYYPDGEDAYHMSMNLTGWNAEEQEAFSHQQGLTSEQFVIV
eukprot:762029-Hanusia_phi.AAC.1